MFVKCDSSSLGISGDGDGSGSSSSKRRDTMRGMARPDQTHLTSQRPISLMVSSCAQMPGPRPSSRKTVRQRTHDNTRRTERVPDAHLGTMSPNMAIGDDGNVALSSPRWALETSPRLPYLRNNISGERQTEREAKRCGSKPSSPAPGICGRCSSISSPARQKASVAVCSVMSLTSAVFAKVVMHLAHRHLLHTQQ